MTTRLHFRVGPSTAVAVLVRVIAFAVAVLGLGTIAAVLVVATIGRMAYQTAWVAGGIAIALLVTAAVMVRPFDPLQR